MTAVLHYATEAYLWLSVIVWLTALVQSIRFQQPMFFRAMQATLALWAAALLAGRDAL